MIKDNKYGKLITTEDIGPIPSGTLVGDCIYHHGLAIITNPDLVNEMFISESFDITWKSNLPVFETTYFCKLKDYEYNFTLNPSAADSNGNIKNNLTGSEFRPYITSVGLYNDAQELLAVAKLGRPVPKSNNTDMVLKITLDY